VTNLPTVSVFNAPGSVSTSRLVDAFFAGLSPRTKRAYAGELRRFQGWTKARDLDELAKLLMGSGPGAANDLVLRWRDYLVEGGRSTATVNRSLAAIRSFLRLAETLGMIQWTLRVPGLRLEALVDVEGPTTDELRALLQAAEGQTNPAMAARDTAVMHLLLRGLRRLEIVSLDLEHVDLERERVLVLAKGKRKRAWKDLALPQAVALGAWIAQRGTEPGPLFLGVGGPNKGHRLCGDSIWRVVRKLGKLAGSSVRLDGRIRPHGVRHATITAVLNEGGSLVEAQAFAGHSNPATTTRYDDARHKRAKKAAGLIYQALKKKEGPS
jgi:integrase/recombinase XerC